MAGRIGWKPALSKLMHPQNFDMPKEKPNRIYIFVPRILETSRGKVKMSNGRAAAQCAHIAAKLVEAGYKDVSKMTTMVMAASGINHLVQIEKALNLFKIVHFYQFDTLGDDEEIFLQAIATEPVTKKQSEIFQFCELW